MVITGVFTMGEIRTDSPERLACLEPDIASRLFVYRYLEGGSRPTAIQILKPHRLAIPLSISALNITRPPQSYIWVTHPGEVY